MTRTLLFCRWRLTEQMRRAYPPVKALAQALSFRFGPAKISVEGRSERDASTPGASK